LNTYQLVAVIGAGMTLVAVPALFVRSPLVRWVPILVLLAGFGMAWGGLILDLAHHASSS
jgi:hypothetical protein